MDTIKALKTRRTVREFSDKKVDIEILGQIVDVARFAPSAGNIQNWKLIFVEDQETKNKLSQFSQNQTWMTSAPVLIVICNEYKPVQELYGDKQGQLYSIQNVALMAGHLLIAAHALGLSTAWIAVQDDFEVGELLGIPDDIDPEIIIALGYEDEVDIELPPKKNINEITFFEKWGNKEKQFPSPKSKFLDFLKEKIVPKK